jgi:hypothetical protein
MSSSSYFTRDLFQSMDYQRCTTYFIELYATGPNGWCKTAVYRLEVVETCMCTSKFADTDSIIFLHLRGLCPLVPGTLLGQMQPEYEKWVILEYCSGKLYIICVKT